MQRVHIRQSVISAIRALQKLPDESNGKITIDEYGEVEKWTHRQGQIMESCDSGCVLNYHTHPPDYINLYPDHPSSTDMKYIYTSTCSLKELGAHLIFTPKWIYAIHFECNSYKASLFKFFTLRSKIDSIFDELSEIYDRSSETFRSNWIEQLRDLGFVIREFTYLERVEFESPIVPTKVINSKHIFILCLIICIFLYTRN